MKHIFDKGFKYKPSFDTDVKKTFDRIRREQAEAAKVKAEKTINLEERRHGKPAKR